MKTELETTKSENIALEGQTQNIDPNAPSSIGGITQNMQNMGASGAAFQASIPEGQGLTTVTGPIQTTTRRIITTTNNVPIENISINNINGTALGTTKTTTTTTTTHYNLGQTEGSNIQMIQGQGGSGMVMGVGGGVEDQAQDITYSSNTGHNCRCIYTGFSGTALPDHGTDRRPDAQNSLSYVGKYQQLLLYKLFTHPSDTDDPDRTYGQGAAGRNSADPVQSFCDSRMLFHH